MLLPVRVFNCVYGLPRASLLLNLVYLSLRLEIMNHLAHMVFNFKSQKKMSRWEQKRRKKQLIICGIPPTADFEIKKSPRCLSTEGLRFTDLIVYFQKFLRLKFNSVEILSTEVFKSSIAQINFCNNFVIWTCSGFVIYLHPCLKIYDSSLNL